MCIFAKIKYFFSVNKRIHNGALVSTGFSDYMESNYFHNDKGSLIDWHCYAFLTCEHGYSKCRESVKSYFEGAMVGSFLMLLLVATNFLDIEYMEYFVATKNAMMILLFALWAFLAIRQWDMWIDSRIFRLMSTYHLLKLNNLLGEECFDATKEPVTQVDKVFELFGGLAALKDIPEPDKIDQIFQEYETKHLMPKKAKIKAGHISQLK